MNDLFDILDINLKIFSILYNAGSPHLQVK